MKKFISVLRVTGALFFALLTFIIGLIDRVILLPLFWKESPNLFSEKYYRSQFQSSIIRVILAAIVIGLYFLVRWVWFLLF